jgi:copper chaperone
MIKLKITGMTCGHCEKAVKSVLEGVPGVSRVVEVSREREQALLEGNADPKALIAAIQEEGYAAEVIT